jgi:hypothetical protein
MLCRAPFIYKNAGLGLRATADPYILHTRRVLYTLHGFRFNIFGRRSVY